MNLKIIPLMVLCGCSSLTLKDKQTQISENIPNKAINTVTVNYNEKSLFNIKANSHRDPHLKGDLIRQEYFVNFDF